MTFPNISTPRSYGGAVPGAYITTDIPAYYVENQAIAVSSLAGWYEVGDDGQQTTSPLGTRGPFIIAVNLGQANEEKILCSSLDIENAFITVWSDGTNNGRGYDGTIMSTHHRQTTQNKVNDTFHVFGAVDFLQLNEGINTILNEGGIQGPQGAQGATGAGTQGPQGSQGATGTGTQGAQGAQGSQGSQGATGTGTQGPQGATGIGIQGPQGTQGATGTGTQGAQGSTGAQGATGSQGNRGFQGFQGNQGTQGTTGAQGATGSQGAVGTQGSTGVQGSTGAQGNQGSQGQRGYQGYQGQDGARGQQGYQGQDGPQGSTGAQGPQGNNGQSDKYATNSPTEYTLGSDSNHTFVLDTPNLSYTPGQNVVLAGDAMNLIHGTVVYYNAGTNELNVNIDTYIGSGAHVNWSVNLDGAVGIQGAQGAQGDQGAQGYQGGEGPQGNEGPQGQDGLQGPQGNDGLQGSQGDQGLQGPRGYQGSAGSQGTAGSQGDFGPQGPQGYQGLTGDPGIYESNDGVPPVDENILWLDETVAGLGAQGAQGEPGAQGPQGARGYQGSTGAQGANGTNGTQGSQGTQGNQGARGFQGSQGNNGAQGAQGSNGAQGPQGNQGSQGNQGTQGATGTGTQGAQGAQGSTYGSSAGQVISMTIWNASDMGFTSNFSTSSTNYATIASKTYTPKSNSSYIFIEAYAVYNYGGGSQADDFYVNLTWNGAEIGYTHQIFVAASGGGTRSGVLFPVAGRVTNGSTTGYTLAVNGKRGTADDNLVVLADGAFYVKITEIAR